MPLIGRAILYALTKVNVVIVGEFATNRASLGLFLEVTVVIALTSTFCASSIDKDRRAKSPIIDKKLHLQLDIGQTMLMVASRIANILVNITNTNFLL